MVQVTVHVTTPTLLICIAEEPTLSIEGITQSNRRRDRTEIDLEVERHVGAGVVVRDDRTADLVVSDLRIDLLPFPVHVVDHGVVHVEERFWNGDQQIGWEWT
jgi:hypothetical protein